MIIRQGHLNTVYDRMNKLSNDRIIMKRIVAAAQDGPLNAARSRSYTPELISNCDIKYSKDKRETAGGGKENFDAEAWIYDPAFTAGDRDIVNIGGTVKNGAVSGGTDYRIVHMAPYEDCVKLDLASL